MTLYLIEVLGGLFEMEAASPQAANAQFEHLSERVTKTGTLVWRNAATEDEFEDVSYVESVRKKHMELIANTPALRTLLEELGLTPDLVVLSNQARDLDLACKAFMAGAGGE